MKQYWALKAQASDALLFFRMGDFYELFGPDAIEASEILKITLTSRDKTAENPTPMAGVPHHAAETYIERLLKAGKKLAIAEQLQDPSQTKGIVERGIVRVLTPAVHFSMNESSSNYLASIVDEEDESLLRLCCLDVCTGETLIELPVQLDQLIQKLDARPIRHVLVLSSRKHEITQKLRAMSSTLLVEDLPSNYLSMETAKDLVKKNFHLATLETFFPGQSVFGVGVLVQYTLRSQKNLIDSNSSSLTHLTLPHLIDNHRHLKLGPNSAKHLDLFPSDENSDDLYSLVNRTQTSMGARTLKRWMEEPLKNADFILERQDGVRELFQQAECSQNLKKKLKTVYDLERISGRISTGFANPRDLAALTQSLHTIFFGKDCILAALSKGGTQILMSHRKKLAELKVSLAPTIEHLIEALVDNPPLHIRDGGIFKKGVSEELDRLIRLTEESEKWLLEYEQKERGRTKISNLKVRFNRVFGYYIEVSKSQLANTPENYQRKQSMANAERFFTSELKAFEEEVLSASEKRKALESKLFEELLKDLKEKLPSIALASTEVAQLDTLLSLSHLAHQPGWSFPHIDESTDMEIERGRHPLVERNSHFVPNDVSFKEARNLLITGPNMGGKSTLMRQTALIILLGQMGAPVPAKRARWGSVHSIFTRIGAQDAISKGQSTFMVEMNELAHILHEADERSLIVLDEIGRGTSTYDGLSVAWATLEWIDRKTKARTLFSTHYHELTELAERLSHTLNFHMAVEAKSRSSSPAPHNNLRFLFELKKGATNDSFGVHVAALAGLPTPVIKRAWEVLESLESQANPIQLSSQPGMPQLSLFEENEAPKSSLQNLERRELDKEEKEPPLVGLARGMAHTLEQLDPNQMTPIEALQTLSELKTQYKDFSKTSLKSTS